MKSPKYSILLFAFVSLISVCGCKEGALYEDVTDNVDLDMIAASQLADQYLQSIGARPSKISITVLKYENDQLLYATNTDSIQGYHPVMEETVTAYVNPGEFIFWFSGAGVQDLEGIEFDELSQTLLGRDPLETNADMMWSIIAPSVEEPSSTILKYDIIYDFNGNIGKPIRLDPKIAVSSK